MDGFNFSIPPADTDIQVSGLEVCTVTAARKLSVLFIDCRPIFYVVFLGSRSTEVTSRDVYDMVRYANLLPNFFFEPKNHFVHFSAFFRETVYIHFKFIKLVYSKKPASVLAVRPGFFAVAWT